MKKINVNELKELIGNNKKLLLMFSTDWCGECKMNTKLLEDWQKKYNDIGFYKIDVDDQELWSDDKNNMFSIMTVPTFILFENGEEKRKFEGFIIPGKLDEILNG